MDEAPNEIICLDVDVQLQDLQQNNSLTPSNKVDKRGEIDEVLDEIYALFNTIKENMEEKPSIPESDGIPTKQKE